MRKCVLDLAPKAPWECPAECEGYERRMADVNWRHGTLVTPPTPDAPDSIDIDDSVGALLDEAEDIINAAGPQVRADVDNQRDKEIKKRASSKPKWWPFKRRR